MKLAAAVVLLAAPALAQSNPRYELGWRVRALEREWLAREPAAREKALESVAQAVQSFFAVDIAGAAEQLDEARAELTGASEPWAASLAIAPAARLVDAAAPEVELAVGRMYESGDEREVGLKVFSGSGGAALLDAQVPEDLARPWRGRMKLAGLGAGDHALRVVLSGEASATSERTLSLSLAPQLAARLDALAKALAALPAGAPALERETARAQLALLRSLAAGASEETDYPAARLLDETEQVLAAAAKGERWYGSTRASQFWLALPIGDKPTRVRVLVPPKLDAAKPVPLVVALHGMGGSENLFFDGYGDGAIVKLCQQRGWLLAAPRLGLFGGAPPTAVVDALAERWPVDRARVFLVGHSMGAGLGLRAVQQAPGAFRAFAALSGGMGVKDASALKALPILCAAGERDFGRSGVESLHASLTAAGSQVAALKLYPHCEHLMVVAEALPDVFAWFDGLAK